MEPWLEVMRAISHQAGEAVWAFFDPRNPTALTQENGDVLLVADRLPAYVIRKGDGGAWSAADGAWSAVGSIIEVVSAIAARGEV